MDGLTQYPSILSYNYSLDDSFSVFALAYRIEFIQEFLSFHSGIFKVLRNFS